MNQPWRSTLFKVSEMAGTSGAEEILLVPATAMGRRAFLDEGLDHGCRLDRDLGAAGDVVLHSARNRVVGHKHEFGAGLLVYRLCNQARDVAWAIDR
jgi:hypothetical protein